MAFSVISSVGWGERSEPQHHSPAVSDTSHRRDSLRCAARTTYGTKTPYPQVCVPQHRQGLCTP